MASVVPPQHQVRPRRVLIVGGGVSGLVSLRNITKYGGCDNVELVERKADVGGIWYLENSDLLDNSKLEQDYPRWISPSYPNMIGNVLPEYLSFSHLPFPPRSSTTQPFPSLAETHAYLRAAAEPFLAKGKIRLNTEVVRVDEMARDEGGGWKVVMKDWSADGAGRQIEERWDGVVIATGREEAVWPDCEGIDEVKRKGIGRHAMDYRGPADCRGKRVVVVGNGNSSNDIAAQVVDIALPPVYRSIRHPPLFRFVSLPDPRIIDVAPAVRYTVNPTPTGHQATLHLKDGSEISDVDTIFFGTGYSLHHPFLRVLDRSAPGKRTLVPLTTNDEQPSRIPFLYRHILYAHNPSLAFVGAIMCLTPFIMSDLCSTFLALAWSGTLPYPGTVAGRLVDDAERMEVVRKVRAETDDPSNFLACHVLGDLEQAYAHALREEIVRVCKDLDDVFHPWTPEEVASRDAMYSRKLESLRLAKEGT